MYKDQEAACLGFHYMKTVMIHLMGMLRENSTKRQMAKCTFTLGPMHKQSDRNKLQDVI